MSACDYYLYTACFISLFFYKKWTVLYEIVLWFDDDDDDADQHLENPEGFYSLNPCLFPLKESLPPFSKFFLRRDKSMDVFT
ncbi:hypothetical protein GDO81_021784 [Engystomops pustulosus]|uniref:Uncharacterized protein n=1 Tax=Engystomops pustulosus TaxID=76066 RepID=A0AAV6Z789_ENGPU|nr:hypothetical protein GDO81_021784 [Engystomops pustulosus]